MPGSDTERALVIEMGTKTGVPMSPWTRPTPRHMGSGPGHCQACRDLAEQSSLGSDTGCPGQVGGPHAMRVELNGGPQMPGQGACPVD